MKHKLLCLLSLTVVFTSGCVRETGAPVPNNANLPTGTFAGVFTRKHINSKGVIDSAKANIQLQMEIATGFAVTGDTSTLQAGSYGGYNLTSLTNVIQFNDKTYPLTGTPAKAHLSGTYEYKYTGTTLQLLGYGALDTLSFYYNLTRTGN
jgi:hypothetical protein